MGGKQDKLDGDVKLSLPRHHNFEQLRCTQPQVKGPAAFQG